jgi:hypothetical protein
MANTKIPSELVAINAISGTLIADNAITSVHIAENNITAVQIAINAVTALQMADGTITSAKIADGTIVTADIADGQITTGKLADSSVTTGKIAAGTIASADIANNAILTQHIDDNQITADQIADNAVGVDQLAGITRGSVLIGNAAGNPSLLALGAANTLLQSDGTDLVFAPLQSGIDDNSNAVAITIDSAEKVSIGGTSPTYKFVVSNNNAAGIEFGPEYATDANLVQHYDRTANAYMDVNTIAQNHRFSRGSSEWMRITNLGNVGIGTDSPESLVHIKAADTVTGVIKIEGGKNTVTSNGEINSQLDFGSNDPSVNNTGNIGGRIASVTEADNGAHTGMAFYTFTQDASTDLREKVRITHNGNVGIGTSSPSMELDVRNDGASGIAEIGVRGGSSGAGVVQISGNGTTYGSTSFDLIQNSSGAFVYQRANLPLIFGTNATERMRIDSSGNVVVGTTAKNNSYPARFTTTSLSTPASDEACHILELVGNRNTNAGNQNGMIQFWNTTSTATETARISGIQGTALNSGALTFAVYSAGTYDEAMRIDQNSNVGIGTNGPTAPLHVFKGESGAVGNNTDSSLVLENSSHTYINFLTPASKEAGILWGDSASANTGMITYSHVTDNMTITAADDIILMGNVGVGTTSPAAPLDVKFVDNTNAQRWSYGSSEDNFYLELDTAIPGSGVVTYNFNTKNNGTLYNNNLVLDRGNVGIGAATPNNMSHAQNTAITATQSTGNSWSTPSSGGTYSVQGAIEAAGIRNRHVAKWAFSGNLSANGWYPFTKRSELVSLCGNTGSNSEEGFGMYFRIYTYLSSSGYGEYFSSRVSSTIWVTNNGSNSTQTQELYVGPGWGHAPNAGHDVNTASNAPFRLRVAHHNGSDSTWPAEQTVELRCDTALSGLNSGTSGRQLIIYGYII